MQLGANVAAEMNVRIWENFSTRAGAYREGLKVSQIPQDVGWVAVGQMVVAKGREREGGGCMVKAGGMGAMAA